MKRKWKTWLENTKIISETLTAAWPVLKLILVAAGTYLVAVMMVNTGKKDEMDRYIAQYESYKKLADSSVIFAEQLAGAVSIQEQKANIALARASELDKQVATLRTRAALLTTRRDSLLEKIDSAKTVTDSLQTYIHTVSLQDSIIHKQDSIITTQKTQVNNLHVTLAHKDTTIQLLTTSRDSLLTVIKNIPPAPTNSNRTIFGIKLPSRKTSLLVGAFVGAATTAVILK